MPSSLKLLVVSSLLAFSSFTSARAVPQLERRQGCATIEPYDKNCELPFYLDHNYNMTFDDLSTGKGMTSYNSLSWSGFTVASPDTTKPHYICPASSPNYLRLHANNTAIIDNGATDFFKITSFYFACSQMSTSVRNEKPQACTLSMTAICAGPDSDSILDVTPFTNTYDYAPSSNLVAEMQFVDMGTNGQWYDCYNYTLSAKAADGGPAVLFMDQVEVVNYVYSGFF